MPLLSPATPLLAGLLAGHMLADFVFQTRRMVDAKASFPGLFAHGALVLTIHAAVLAPLLSTPLLLALVAVAVIHMAVDATKIRLARRAGDTLTLFVADQALHLLVLFAVAHLVTPSPFRAAWIAAADYRTTALLVTGIAFNGTGGATLVRLLLARVPVVIPEGSGVQAGRTIGILERMLTFLFMWVGAWTAVGLVLAAKGIARHDELRQRPFAEYYLVGTLASTLTAVGAALFLLALR